MGSLSSVYPLGMLAGLFVWPALSDRVGRKPVISLSLLASAIGLFTQVTSPLLHSLPSPTRQSFHGEAAGHNPSNDLHDPGGKPWKPFVKS